MDTNLDPSTRRHRRLCAAGVIAVATIGGVVAVPLSAGAQHAQTAGSGATLQARSIGKYGDVLTNSAHYSLYVLSTESKGKLHCTAKCVPYWRPLLVAKNAKITAGPGVKGKISHVSRGTKWQVTYNGWPVYTFVVDKGPGQTKGEKVVAFGGTWYLVHAGATTSSGTPVKTVPTGGGTTTTTYVSGY